MIILKKPFAALVIITIPLLTMDLAYAKDFNVGSVKKNISTDGICVAYLPRTQKHILIVPFTTSKSEPIFAWINIDGKDVRLRQATLKVISPKNRSIAKYTAKNISVTVDSRQSKEARGEDISTTTTTETISIDYRGQTKTINTNGKCVF